MEERRVVQAYLGLGANVGNRRATLERAITLLLRRPGIRLLRISSLYETEPVDVGGGWFFNCVAEIETSLSPQQLFETLSQVEEACGRPRTRGTGEARVVDIDLLLYGSEVIATPDLRVPHPRMHLRRFVLEPLAELAAGLRHPGLGLRVSDLLEKTPPVPEVRMVAGDWLPAPDRGGRMS